jgi:hypothetical protein
VELIRHPATPCDAVTRIEVEAARTPQGDLELHYAATGELGGLLLPPATAADRTDELWKHTCFEAFAAIDSGYLEFNLSPSTEWAAYRFDGYREGMRNAELSAAPRIGVQTDTRRFELRTLLTVPNVRLRLGLSAIIEETGGRKSYWALAHPPGKPDFHHPDCFALELRPASAT